MIVKTAREVNLYMFNFYLPLSTFLPPPSLLSYSGHLQRAHNSLNKDSSVLRYSERVLPTEAACPGCVSRGLRLRITDSWTLWDLNFQVHYQINIP